MNNEMQQEAVNLLAEAAQRLGNHCQGGLSAETAFMLMRKIHKFLGRVEDYSGMTNIPEVANPPEDETKEKAKVVSWEVRRAVAGILTPLGSTNPREDWRCILESEIELLVHIAILEHGGLPTGPTLEPAVKDSE